MLISLDSVCEFQGGSQPPKSSWGKISLPGYIRMLQIRDFTQSKESYHEYVPDSRSLKKCTTEDVLIARYGASIGKILTGLSGAYNVALVKTIPDESKLQKPFLKYLLRSTEFQNFINNVGSRAAQAGFNKEDLKSFKFFLPPLEDQKRIVKILDQADALRQKRKQAIELLDEYMKSVFLEMFGDPVTNPKGWKKVSLSTMIEFLTSGSRGWAKYYSNSGNLFLRVQNIGRNELMLNDICYVSAPDSAESKRTKVKEGDILLSITADLGRSAVIPKDLGTAHISQHLALIRLKKDFIPEYVSEFLASEGGKYQIEKFNKGGTKDGLNFNDIRSIIVPLPPLNYQKKYLLKKQYCLSIKQKMLQQSQELETQFQALMQKAFRNEL